MTIALAQIPRNDLKKALAFARERIAEEGSLAPDDARVLARLQSDDRRQALFDALDDLKQEMRNQEG